MYKPEWFKRIQWNKDDITAQGVLIRELRDRITALEAEVRNPYDNPYAWEDHIKKWKGECPSALSLSDIRHIVSALLVHWNLRVQKPTDTFEVVKRPKETA